MEEELKDLKSVLRSLVVSCPTQVDVRSLLRDYRNMMGASIPLTKYGYRDPMVFLKERCSDCFVFQGPASNPILTLIVPESLKHIDNFVQKQKLSSTVKFKGKRRSIPGELFNKPPTNLIASTFKPSVSAVANKPKPQEPVRSNHNVVSNNIGLEYKNRQKADNPTLPISKSIANISISDKENEQSNNIIKSNIAKDESCSSEAVQKFLKKRLPVYKSLSRIENDNEVESNSERTSSRDDADSGRQTLSSSSSSKAAKLEALKNDISSLVADYPEGIWCTDLMRLYRERYGRELDFSRLGYTSVLSLVLALEAAVRASPADSGNWLLTHPSSAPPPRVRRAPRPRSVSIAPVDPDDALPGIDFDPDVFPADCMHFAESIPGASLDRVAPGDLLEVMVGEVYSPSHFWLLRLGPDHYEAMCDLMDEMTKYYTWGEGRDRSLALGAVRVGHYCTCIYERDWHRSLIVRVLDSDTVKVRHVDYGTVETAKVSALKPLLRKWGRLEAMALRARLAGVRPAARGRRWPHAAAAHFLRLVSDARLVANVVGVHAEEDILEVFLVNTQTEDDIFIDKELVRSGHADACGGAPPVSAPLPPASAPLPPADVRSLLCTIVGLGKGGDGEGDADDADAASDISASASEVDGRPPRRLPTWEADACGATPLPAWATDGTVTPTPTSPSSKLARLRALHFVPTPSLPSASSKLARLQALHSKLKLHTETSLVSARSPTSPELDAEVDPDDSPPETVVSVSSRMLRRRLALAMKLQR